MRKFFTPSISLENHIPDEPFVFLGGTVNDSDWRDDLLKVLKVDHYNPIVKNWTEACIKEEEEAKVKAKALLYVITPKQSGTYALVEMAVSACMNRDKKVVIVFLKKDDDEQFDESQLKSNEAVKKLLNNNTNAEFFTTLEDAAEVLNSYISGFNYL